MNKGCHLLTGEEGACVGGREGQGRLGGKGAQRLEEEDECGKATVGYGMPRYKACLNRRAPEPSPEFKRRSHQELAAQSMTWGAQAHLSGRVGNQRGCEKAGSEPSPARVKQGGSRADVRALIIGVAELFGSCAGGK